MTDNPTRTFYDRISGLYDGIADGGEHKARERGLQLLNVQPGERVLEVGYGTGHSLLSLAQAVGEGGHVDGVDISEGMRKVAGKRIADNGLESRVTLKVAETPPLPYEDSQFDVVCMSFTLELFPLTVIPDVLRETGRVLREGGRLGIVSMATTQPGEKDSILERTYKWMHEHFPHIVDCQPIPAENLLSDAGFELTTSERLSLFTMPVAAIVGTYRAQTIGADSTLTSLIEKLGADDAVERLEARRQLCAMGNQATDALTKSLASDNQHVRWEAAKCLAQVADPLAGSSLVEHLGDVDSDVSWVCGEALIALGDASLAPLLNALTNPSAKDNLALYQGAHHVLREHAARGKTNLFSPLLGAFGKSEPQTAVPVEAEKVLKTLGS